MKTFFNLIQEVQKPGLCHRCGGCVTICTAINYGALEMDEEGKPRYKDIEKCIECGLCYAICPENDELDEEMKRQVAWSAPMGRVIETSVARARDPEIRERATDGGVVTALLLHLFDTGRIDGAIVAKQVGPFQRQPILAENREDILASAGFFIDTSHGVKSFGDKYLTYSTLEEFDPLMRRGLRRVAMVGTPCQINAVRRMETLGIVPSDSVRYTFGLFCSGNFVFLQQQRRELAQRGGFDWDEVRRINIKDEFRVHLASGELKRIPLEDMEFMRRHACRYCRDFASEFADVSFGGLGAPEGWTTIITRTPHGRALFADARGKAVEEYSREDDPHFASNALNKVIKHSAEKKKTARRNRRDLGRGVKVRG
jgi:coenzyme F420 hydrogenase subunit beta